MSWTQPSPSFCNCHRARQSVYCPAIWRVSAQRWNGVLNSLASSRTKPGCAQRFSLPAADRKRPTSPISSPATAPTGQEVMQQRMRRAVAELNIGYRHSPIVAEHHSLLPGPRGAHASVLGWHDFGAGPRAGDRAADARLMLCPGRESVRFFQRLRGTKHHLVLFAGALATGETHRRLQALADATTH